ncbi:hypothetical protein DNFV4_01579 [Nitrospira tepida]|uniref:Lipoprotein n=2 Tax=Nitrospira tepida TaxID=2973512 RepID=A0AA86T3T7_9BACT|nr:hypothetical protein DNFV4_01579 [Nitrospira tepida]
MKMGIGRGNGMRTGSGSIVTGGLLAIWILATVGCSSPQPVKGPPSPSNQEVRGHADRTFDKLKEEERQGRDVTQPMR